MTQICPLMPQRSPRIRKTCKHCFQDLTSPPARKFPLGLAVGVFIVSLLAMFGTEHLASSQVIKRYNLSRVSSTSHRFFEPRRNQPTAFHFHKSSIWNMFKVGNHTKFEIVAVTKTGDRILLQGDDKSLTRQVKDMADKTDLIVKKVNNQKGI